MLHDLSGVLPSREQTSNHFRGLVAKVLLEHAGDGTGEPNRLTKRDIAALAGTDWGTVHMSLVSLQDQGAIRIERHRLIIDKDLLQKAAGVT